MKGFSFLAVLVTLAFVAGAAGAAPAAKPKVKTEAAKAPEREAQPERDAAPQSPVAINNMANMYYKGQGVKQDYAKALYLYKKAAGEGHMASVIAVGYMHELGQGTKRDYAAAMQWYQKAAVQGYAVAEKAIGDLYFFGRGVGRDDVLAARWYKKAADQNLAEAQCRLGYMIIRGRGVSQDLVGARALLEAGAAQDNACSQHYLAFMYMNGMITALPDTKRALALDKLAAGNGNVEAQYNMGKANEIGWVEYGNEPDALNWYTLSANGGYPLAMERLAEIYDKGDLKEKEAPEKAAMWRERAKAAWATWPEMRPATMEKVRFMPPK